MDTQLWSRPVQFETDLGRYRVLTSTEEASHFLLNNWPAVAGPKCIDAQRACLDVMAGAAQPDEAREAFVEACEEADMHVVQ
ncbi:DUF982 domain-containing protein [Labrys sp. KNU-23]|uniref:DUF982 domain-containing protein n=1 Tax=Labrys sp. KNU-23 TaxID=2789216 RepID=UPI0011ECDA71|nr:DUF982 domain-containing protein [Labrys sp. KNU-23]QEN84831.1 DUF982 domain-containing protein [Labrys sp. KNU-23]